jgi:hypothetical protein
MFAQFLSIRGTVCLQNTESLRRASCFENKQQRFQEMKKWKVQLKLNLEMTLDLFSDGQDLV